MVLAFLLPACSVLSDSQVTNINAFAITASHYSDYPSEVFKKRVELRLETELIGIIPFSDFSKVDGRIEAARATYDTLMALSDTLDKPIQVIQQYAAMLTELSSDRYTRNMNNSSINLGANLDGLVAAFNSVSKDTVPAGIGGELSNIIWALGRRATRSRQAAALKKFIPLGNVLIASAVNNLTEILGDSFKDRDGNRHRGLKAMLADEKKDCMQNFQNLVFNGRPGNNYTVIRQYYDMKTDYVNVESLRLKCTATAIQLAKAHDALAKNIAEKKDLKEIIKETQDLATDFRDLGRIAAFPSHINL
jgi:hypothetical protein